MAVVVVASANYNIVQRVFKMDNDRFDFESSCTTNSGSGNRWYGQMLLTEKKTVCKRQEQNFDHKK